MSIFRRSTLRAKGWHADSVCQRLGHLVFDHHMFIISDTQSIVGEYSGRGSTETRCDGTEPQRMRKLFDEVSETAKPTWTPVTLVNEQIYQ